jgi:hypothetical protein
MSIPKDLKGKVHCLYVGPLHVGIAVSLGVKVGRSLILSNLLRIMTRISITFMALSRLQRTLRVCGAKGHFLLLIVILSFVQARL